MFGSCRYKLSRISEVAECAGGGLYKRIDQNRALAELLQREAPGLLARFPRIEVWLNLQDEFLLGLEAVVPMAPRRFTCDRADRPYPRPWPSGAAPADGAQAAFDISAMRN